jgi:hypothetical protein
MHVPGTPRALGVSLFLGNKLLHLDRKGMMYCLWQLIYCLWQLIEERRTAHPMPGALANVQS